MQNDKEMKGRVAWIDVMRGIGIFLVVFAHIYQNKANGINNIIFTFHMPLFFFISGYVYQKKEEGFDKYFIRKIKQIVVPYFVWVVLSFVYWVVLERSFRSAEAQISVAKGFAGIFRAEYYWIMYNVVLWFLPVLFGVEILFELLMRLKVHPYVKICMVILSGIVGIILFDVELPWGINRVFRYIVFYVAGYVCRILPKKNNNTGIIAVLAVLSGGGNLVLYAMGLRKGVWFYIIGILGILCMMMISILLQRIKVLELLGRNTMAILVMHGPFYRVMVYLIAILLHTSTEVLRNNLLVSILLSVVVIALLGIPTSFLNKYLPWTIGKRKVE